MRTFGVGMVGYGSIARMHMLGWKGIPYHYGLPADTVRVVGVATNHEETAREAAGEIGCDFWTDDYRQLLERDDVDIITISTPNDVREDIVIAAAEAGKHILCEKPLARTVAEGERMVEAVEAAGVKAQVNYNYRFYPAVTRARQLIEAGFVGRVYSFRGTYYRSSYIDPAKPLSWKLVKERAGSGALHDLATHTIDMLTYLLGECESVFGVTRTLIDERPVSKGSDEMGAVDVDDVALLEMRLSSGALGSVQASRFATGTTNELTFEIFGENGSLRFNSSDPAWLWAYDRREEKSPVDGFHRVKAGSHLDGQLVPDATLPPGVESLFAASQLALLHAIESDTTPSPSFREAMHVQRIMESALRSADQGCWVDVPVAG